MSISCRACAERGFVTSPTLRHSSDVPCLGSKSLRWLRLRFSISRGTCREQAAASSSLPVRMSRFLRRRRDFIPGCISSLHSNGCISSLFRVYYFITLLQVSAKQQDMEGKFAVVNRAVDILITYEHKLPERIQAIYDSMSGRWTNLKTKVGQAKQKIGPRIREE